MKPTHISVSGRGQLLTACLFLIISVPSKGQEQDKTLPDASKRVRAEKLIKDRTEYYGWQESQEKFLTCDRNEVSIGDGKVTKASRDCPGGPPINLTVQVLTGYLDIVDVDKGTFSFKSAEGTVLKFFVPQSLASEQKLVLKAIRPGDKITVTTLTKGRADAVKAEG